MKKRHMMNGFVVGFGLLLLSALPAAAEQGGAGTLMGEAETVIMNGRSRPDLPIATDDQGGWSFRYERDLREDPAEWLGKDAPRTNMRWKDWRAHEDLWRRGMFGPHMTFQIEFPYPVRSVTSSAKVSNFSDLDTRRAFLEYSLDNLTWRTIAETEYGAGGKEFDGTAEIEDASYRVWFRMRQGAGDANAVQSGNIVFQALSFSVGGPVKTPDPEEFVLVVPDEPAAVPRASGGFAGKDYVHKLPDKPALTQADAAERLRMLIGRATDAWPRTVPASLAPRDGRRIYVGYGPHLEGRVEPPAEPEGLKILERDGDVFLLGEMAEAGVNNWPVPADRGVMHAVETFAERVMGYRFLYSPLNKPELFELGTAIPALDTLRIEPGLRIEEAPVFRHRTLWGPYHNEIEWKGIVCLGYRTGSAPAFNCNHSYNMQAWKDMYAEKHPEMFIPKGSEGRHPNFLDYTEPLVLEKRLEHVQTFFNGEGAPGFSRTPTRKYIREEPPDMAPPAVSYNERSRELFNPHSGTLGQFSNIWFDYQRRLAIEVGKRWPHMRVSSLAYMRHYIPPTFKIPDNIDVQICLMRSSTGNKEPEVFNKNLADVREWANFMGNDRDRLFLWEYGHTGGMDAVPQLFPFALQKWIQAVRPHVSGAFVEWSADPPEYYLMPRLWTRLLWDPDMDVAAEIADVCDHLHGPAGDAMTEFYRLMIERFEMQWENPKLIWDQYYLTPDLFYGQSYRPADIERLGGLLEKARREVGLPAVIEAKVRHGSAVYLFNAEDTDVPVGVTLSASDHELVNPGVGWKGGRFVWRGRLQPGERLDIRAGRAMLTSADGVAVKDGGSLEGDIPTLAAGSADVFHFWHDGPKRDEPFTAELSYGADSLPGGEKQVPRDMEQSIYARRLAWVRDPYLVFHQREGKGIYGTKQRGFFPEAHMIHQYLGRVPTYEAVRVDALPDDIDNPLWGDLPVAELVRGKSTGLSYERNGFLADRRTRVRFVYGPEGLAARIVADGAPVEGEKLVLRLNDKALEFAVTEDPAEGRALRRVEIDEGGWRGLAVVAWRELGLAGDAAPTEVSAQITRERGADVYAWSPPLGTRWTPGTQGPGKLLLGAPAR